MKAIYFLNRDLRLRDNKTLSEACKSSTSLNLVYCLDSEYAELSSAQKHFIYESLEDLNASLSKKESSVKIYAGEASNLVSKTKDLGSVYLSKVFNSGSFEKQKKIIEACDKMSVEVSRVENTALYEINGLPFDLENMPRVFTSFRKKIEKENLDIPFQDVPKNLPKNFECDALDFDLFKGWQLEGVKNMNFKGGESEGQKRLQTYFWETDSALTYKDTRNGMVEFNDSTKFSPWLAVGALSPRDIMMQLAEYESSRGANESTYWIYFELMWRDYFKLYSLKFGSRIFEMGGIDQKKIETDSGQERLFENWSQAQTGNDFVDANMNELATTGWMSNRGRQNVASYLSKDLFVDWTKGARWFAKHLIDYDVESNWGNWNYVAGVGVDPRDRKFNIQRQADVYDPNKIYVQKFLNR